MKKDLCVIIPAYGVGEYLGECLESCARQNCGEMAVIVSDDGSPDDSAKIADEFAARDSRFVALHRKNGGVARARNAAIDIADAKWLWFVDGDDMIAEDSLDSLKPLFGRGDEIIYFKYMMFGGKRDFEDTLEVSELSGGDIDELRRQTVYHNKLSPMKHFWMASSSFAIYSAEFLAKNGVRTPPLSKGQDSLFNFIALLKCGRAATFDKTLYYYRRNEGSVTVRFNMKIIAQTSDLLRAFSKLIESSDDAELAARMARRVMQMSRVCAFQYFCNAHNDATYFKRRAEFMAYMKAPELRAAFKGAWRVRESLFDRTIYTLFEFRQFMVLNALYRIYTRRTRGKM